MPVPTLPSVLANGTVAYGSEVRANDDAIVAVMDHGLARDNFKVTGADIPGSVLTTTATERVTANRLEDDACDERVLKDGVSGDGYATAGVNRASHIKNGIITAAKLSGQLGASALRVASIDYALTANPDNGGAGTIVDGGMWRRMDTGTGLPFIAIDGFSVAPGLEQIDILHVALVKTSGAAVAGLEYEVTVHHILDATGGATPGVTFMLRREYRPVVNFGTQTITPRAALSMAGWVVRVTYIVKASS